MNKTFALKIGKSLVHDNLRVNDIMVERFQYEAWIPYLPLHVVVSCIELGVFELIGEMECLNG